MPDVICDMTVTDSTDTTIVDLTDIPSSQVSHIFRENLVAGNTINVVVKSPPDTPVPDGPNVSAEQQQPQTDNSPTSPIDSGSRIPSIEEQQAEKSQAGPPPQLPPPGNPTDK